jgi:hypothetical protein
MVVGVIDIELGEIYQCNKKAGTEKKHGVLKNAVWLLIREIFRGSFL